MRKGTLLGMVLFVILPMGIVACGGNAEAPTPVPTATSTQLPSPTPTPAIAQPSNGAEVTGEVVHILQTDIPPRFQPDHYTFEVGHTYALHFAEVTQFHTFTVEELGLNINIFPGESAIVQFTPTQAGTFQLICIPHGGSGMVGTVTVQ